MFAVFQHVTFCRFSDAVNVRTEDLLFDVDYFKIHISYSKTDQAGRGQYAYIPRLSSAYRSPHMLMCLYIQRLGLGHPSNDTLEYIFPPLV